MVAENISIPIVNLFVPPGNVGGAGVRWRVRRRWSLKLASAAGIPSCSARLSLFPPAECVLLV